jgi:L,D-transpeptidase catalytic domain
MSAQSRTVFAVAMMGTLLAVAPSVLATSATDDGGSSLSAAEASGLSGANRGTMVQIEPLPETPTTVLGDSLIVPADSGSGRRVVYSKTIQRVWLIDENDLIYNTHRVSGRPDSPPLGTFEVYSRSTTTCAILHPDICMRFMVRFAHKGLNNIGFHEIPQRHGVPLQSDDQLGLALSGGCVRQSTADAIIMWDWAQLGTVVVVVP